MSLLGRFISNPLSYVLHPVVCLKGVMRRLGVYKEPECNIEIESTGYIERTGNESWEVNLREKVVDDQGEFCVKNGVFKGLKYPELVSTCSSIWPKIIGSYEYELQQVISEVVNKEYDYIFDVGCAEGYYAIGLALKIKSQGRKSQIIAFDNDENAVKLCGDMRSFNNVEDFVDIREWCSPELLGDFDFGEKSLVIADCEGYERELFNKNNIKNLANVDLIVEIHDWNQYETPTLDLLVELFEQTHQVQVIKGVDDYEKAYRYKFPETMEYEIATRFKIFAEGRRRCGMWLYIQSKK